MGSAARAEALSPQTNSRPLRAWQQAALAAVRGAVPEGLPGHRDPGRGEDHLRPDAGRAAARPARGRPRRRRLPDRPPAHAVGRRRRRHGDRAGPGPHQRRRAGARGHPGLRDHLRAGRRQADAARRPRHRRQDAGHPRRGAPRRRRPLLGRGGRGGLRRSPPAGCASPGRRSAPSPTSASPSSATRRTASRATTARTASAWSAAPTTPTATRRRWPTASSGRSSSPPTPGRRAGGTPPVRSSPRRCRTPAPSRWRCRPGGPRWTPRASGCRTSSPRWTTGSPTCARGGMPDAAGLILASDQDDARAYAKIVRRVTGKAAELILSDDPKASKKIERFATGSARIAVCVRMISEGVDVPRAAVLAWMTSYRTPLFFAQAVGRVVRSRGAARVGDRVPARGPPAAVARRLDGGGAQPRHAPAEDGAGRRARPRAAAPEGEGPRRPEAVGGPGGRRALRPRAAQRNGAHRRGLGPDGRGRRGGRGVPRHPGPAHAGADRRAAVEAGRRAPASGSQRATGPTTTSWSSRTTPTRTTPVAPGGTPPSCAGRSTAWSTGWRRGRRRRRRWSTRNFARASRDRRRRPRRWTSSAPAASASAPCCEAMTSRSCGPHSARSGQDNKPRWAAIATASVRPLAPSLAMMLLTCTLAVFSLM